MAEKKENFFSKLMSKIVITDDDEDMDDEDYSSENDDYEDIPEVKSRPARSESPKTTYSSYVDDEEEEEYSRPVKAPKVRNKRTANRQQSSYDSSDRSMSSRMEGDTNVISIRRGDKVIFEVCVKKPTSIEDGRIISDTLLEGKAVVLNLEGIDVNLAQRIIDYTGGACYSIGGKLRGVTRYIYLAAPKSIEISGDLIEMIETTANSFGSYNNYY